MKDIVTLGMRKYVVEAQKLLKNNLDCMVDCAERREEISIIPQ